MVTSNLVGISNRNKFFWNRRAKLHLPGDSEVENGRGSAVRHRLRLCERRATEPSQRAVQGVAGIDNNTDHARLGSNVGPSSATETTRVVYTRVKQNGLIRAGGRSGCPTPVASIGPVVGKVITELEGQRARIAVGVMKVAPGASERQFVKALHVKAETSGDRFVTIMPLGNSTSLHVHANVRVGNKLSVLTGDAAKRGRSGDDIARFSGETGRRSELDLHRTNSVLGEEM